MADILHFDLSKKRIKPKIEAQIDYIYAPEVYPNRPYAIRIVSDMPDCGIWLTTEEYLDLLRDMIDIVQTDE